MEKFIFMIPIFSLVTSVKDYFEIVHKLVEVDPRSINYDELGSMVTYFVILFKNVFENLLNFSWLNNFWSLPIIIPDISAAMVSEISVLDGYFHNALPNEFLNNNSVSGVTQSYSEIEQNQIILCLEKFSIGLVNSFFLCLPTSTAHLITLRRFVRQGLNAGYISGLGTLFGNLFWLTSIIFGWRFFVIPWLSLDIFRYVLGFALLLKYMWDTYNEKQSEPFSKTIISKNSSFETVNPLNNQKGDLPPEGGLAKGVDFLRFPVDFGLRYDPNFFSKVTKEHLQIFLLNFTLVLTEQTSIYPFIGDLTVSPEASLLEIFPNYLTEMQFVFVHLSYLLGIGLGSLSLLHLTCWFWENTVFNVYLWVISSFKISTGFYYKLLNLGFLYLIMLSAVTSIPYYGLDYTITNPLGYLSDDRLVQDKIVLETSFLGSNPSDRNTRLKRGRRARSEKWKQRIRKYRTFDASLYGRGSYDFFPIEDLNYGFDRFWLRRKLKNHRAQSRVVPRPWLRSFKKQLAKPRLESYSGPRIEFFRLLFEQVYHPSFHAFEKSFKKVPIIKKKNLNAALPPAATPEGGQPEGTRYPEGLRTPQQRLALPLQAAPLRGAGETLQGVKSFFEKNSISTKWSGLFPQTTQLMIGKNLSRLHETRNLLNNSFIPGDLGKALSYGIEDNLIQNNLKKSTLRKFVRKVDSRIQVSTAFLTELENSLVNYSQGDEFRGESKLLPSQIIFSDASNTASERVQEKAKSFLKKDLKRSFKGNLDLNNLNTHLKFNAAQGSKAGPSGCPPSGGWRSDTEPSFYKLQILKYRSLLVTSNPIKKITLAPIPSPQAAGPTERPAASLNQNEASAFSLKSSLNEKNEKFSKFLDTTTTTNKNNNFSSNNFEHRMLLHPLKFYLQQEAGFKRKLRYYTPNIYRKFSVENNAPYFSIMMKRYFYYYKPTSRWERTMKVAGQTKIRRKTTRIPRKLSVSKQLETSASLPDLFEKSTKNSLSPPSLQSIERLPTSAGSSFLNFPKKTYNYSVVSKRASRYRFQIYKDVLQHWYYSPFNRLLLKLDVDSFIRRQPKAHFLTEKEENLLHFRRFLLSEHYNTLRWYSNMEHYRSMKTQLNGSTKSFSSRVYNQQFSGTFKKIRHLFAITPSQSISAISVLKFDQPLYNEFSNTFKNPLLNPLIIHEELLNPFIFKKKVGLGKAQSAELEKLTNFNQKPTTLLKSDSSFNSSAAPVRGAGEKVLASTSNAEGLGNPKGAAAPSGIAAIAAGAVSPLPFGEGATATLNFKNEDFFSKSQNIVGNYLKISENERQNYIKKLLNDHNYAELTRFLYSGKKLRGTEPTTNQRLFNYQESSYLINPNSVKIDGKNEKNFLLSLYEKTLAMQGAEKRDLYVTYLKHWKKKVTDQISLKKYLARHVEKREKRKLKKEKHLIQKLQFHLAQNELIGSDPLRSTFRVAEEQSRQQISKNSNLNAGSQNLKDQTNLSNVTSSKSFELLISRLFSNLNISEKNNSNELLTTGLKKSLIEGVKILDEPNLVQSRKMMNEPWSDSHWQGLAAIPEGAAAPSGLPSLAPSSNKKINLTQSQNLFKLKRKVSLNSIQFNDLKLYQFENILKHVESSISQLNKIILKRKNLIGFNYSTKKKEGLPRRAPVSETAQLTSLPMESESLEKEIGDFKNSEKSLISISTSFVKNRLALSLNKLLNILKLTENFALNKANGALNKTKSGFQSKFLAKSNRAFSFQKKKERQRERMLTRKADVRKEVEMFKNEVDKEKKNYSNEEIKKVTLTLTKGTTKVWPWSKLTRKTESKRQGLRTQPSPAVNFFASQNLYSASQPNPANNMSPAELQKRNNELGALLAELDEQDLGPSSSSRSKKINPIFVQSESLSIENSESMTAPRRGAGEANVKATKNKFEGNSSAGPLGSPSGRQQRFSTILDRIWPLEITRKNKPGFRSKGESKRSFFLPRKSTLRKSLKNDFKTFNKEKAKFLLPESFAMSKKENFYKNINEKLYGILPLPAPLRGAAPTSRSNEKITFGSQTSLEQLRNFQNFDALAAGGRAIAAPSKFKLESSNNDEDLFVFKKTNSLIKAKSKMKRFRHRRLKNYQTSFILPRGRFSQKRQRFEKRRRSTFNQLRRFNKHVKKKINEIEMQNWWWQEFLPSIQTSTERVWQIEKDKLIEEKLSQLSVEDILASQNSHQNNHHSTLQIGNKDFKPLALPESLTQIQNLVLTNNNFIDSSGSFEKSSSSLPQSEGLRDGGAPLRQSAPSPKGRGQQPREKDYLNSNETKVNLNNKKPNIFEIVNQLYVNLFLDAVKQRSISSQFPEFTTEQNSPAPLRGADSVLLSGEGKFQSLQNVKDLPRRDNSLSSIDRFMLPNAGLPFYAGWDESLRKFVVTNRMLSRQNAGYEIPFLNLNTNSKIDTPHSIPSLNSLTKTVVQSGSTSKDLSTGVLEFTEAPLKGMNAPTTLYWQVPFITYDTDQFFTLGIDGFAPLGWKQFLFRHTILKSWLNTLNLVDNSTSNELQKNNLVSPKKIPPAPLRGAASEISKMKRFTLEEPVVSRSAGPPYGEGSLDTKRSYQHANLNVSGLIVKSQKKILNSFSNYSARVFKSNESNLSILKNKKSLAFSRRLKKRYSRVKTHPNNNRAKPCWYPSGSLLNQVLPVHYIYVFYKRNRFPKDRYLKRRLFKNKTLNQSSFFQSSKNQWALSNLDFFGIDFTLRKRLKPKRKYHLKRDSSKIVIPRRFQFTSLNQLPEIMKKFRPLSAFKMNKPLEEFIKERQILRRKQRQKELFSSGKQPNQRVKPLRRRIQRQVLRQIWRHRPRAGGFVWPGDYLKLELVQGGHLELNQPDSNEAQKVSKLQVPENKTNKTKISKQSNQKTRRTFYKKRTPPPSLNWPIQPKRYLYEKHNEQILKKRKRHVF